MATKQQRANLTTQDPKPHQNTERKQADQKERLHVLCSTYSAVHIYSFMVKTYILWTKQSLSFEHFPHWLFQPFRSLTSLITEPYQRHQNPGANIIMITRIFYSVTSANISNSASKHLNPVWPAALTDPRLSSSPRDRLRRAHLGWYSRERRGSASWCPSWCRVWGWTCLG